MDALTEVAGQLRISLTPAQASQLSRFAELLLEANVRAGLTSGKTDRETLYRRHLAESLALLAALEVRGMLASPVIDIGTGGGLPGLPMKIARPDLEITLLEATGKKAQFLLSVVAELGLSSVTVIHGRAEDLAHDSAHRGAYRLALARAVAPLRTLLEIALPFLAPGGVLAAPKGSSAPREIVEAERALGLLGGEIEGREPLRIPGDAGPVPALVIVRKVAPTPAAYPRRAGIPAKRPL